MERPPTDERSNESHGSISSPPSSASLSPATTDVSTSTSTREFFISQVLGGTTSDWTSERTRPSVLGIHHLKFAVSNLDVSIAWYERVLGARRVPGLDHLRADGVRFAAVCHLADWAGIYLELRYSRTQARHARGVDPITLSVSTRADLTTWIEWLDRWGTTRSPLLAGMRGWILIFEDPDGRRITLYTLEAHDGAIPPSTDPRWLSDS